MKAILEWRKKLANAHGLDDADLDDLEERLRDELEALAELGITGEDAFATATKRVGLAGRDERLVHAWSSALFWMSGGVLFALVGRPAIELAEHAGVISTIALGLTGRAISATMWTVSFASPVLVLGALFWMTRRWVDAPVRWARSSLFRVALVTCSAATMLAFHLHSYFGWLDRLEHRWSPFTRRVAVHAASNATYSLAVAIPLLLLGVLIQQRAKARTNGVPLFWLATGILIGAIKWELHFFVRSALLALGQAAQLAPTRMSVVMWLVTLGTPLLLFGSAYAFVCVRTSGPSEIARRPLLVVGMAMAAALAIGAVFVTEQVAALEYGRTRAAFEIWDAGTTAWLLAGIVSSVVVPVLVGSVVLTLALRVPATASR